MNLPKDNRPQKKSQLSALEFLLLLVTIALLAFFLMPRAAQAQLATSTAFQTGQPNFMNVDTNFAAYALTNGQTLTYTAGSTNTYQKTLRQKQGLTLFLAVWQTATAASASTNYTVYLDLTGDGSTWTKGNGAYPIVWTVPLAGAGVSTNVFWTNISPTVLDNVRKIQVTKVSTTAATNVAAALAFSQGTQ